MKKLTDEEVLALWKEGKLAVVESVSESWWYDKKTYEPDPKPLKKGKKK